MTNNHPASLWRKVRAAFEGTEPAQLSGGAKAQDSNAIRVPALAKRFDVHPNSIYLASKKWLRPSWYRMTGSKHMSNRSDARVDGALLKRLARLARRGEACPTNQDLAAALACSAVVLTQAFKRLKAARDISIEKKANQRRVTVGKHVTDWTVLREVEGLLPAPSPIATKSRRCLDLIRALAEVGAACPKSSELVEPLGVANHMAVNNIIEHLATRGAFKIERRTRKVRRFVFPDGVATGWTAYQVTRRYERQPPPAKPARAPAKSMPLHPSGRSGITLRPACGAGDAVKQAQLKLQRAEVVVFDRWVLSGNRREIGRSWSVGGQVVDAAGLIALAAAHAAKSGATNSRAGR